MFKKVSKTVFLLIVLSFTFILIGCKDDGAIPHDTHIVSEEWQVSADEHWHICTVTGCKGVFDKGKHIYDEGSNVCKICGYVKETIPTPNPDPDPNPNPDPNLDPDPNPDPDPDPDPNSNQSAISLLSSNFKIKINVTNEYENTDYEIYRVGNDFMRVDKTTLEGYGTQIACRYYKYDSSTEIWSYYTALSGNVSWSETNDTFQGDDIIYVSDLGLRYVINYPAKPEDLASEVDPGGKEDIYIGTQKYECTVYTTPNTNCKFYICMIDGLQHTLKSDYYGLVNTITEFQIGGVSFPEFPGEIPALP